MIPPALYAKNLQLAESVRHLPGCVVECGVWRGGMSAGLASVLGPDRNYFLFDSFEGLPPAQEIDGERAMKWQRDTASPSYYDNCSASEGFAREAMKLAGVQSAHFHPGWFKDTLPHFESTEPICLLRLDGDWYESTMQCLTYLFDRVTPGGLIVLDDYYAWDGCSRALHDYLSSHGAQERIRSLDDICYMIKLPSSREIQSDDDLSKQTTSHEN